MMHRLIVVGLSWRQRRADLMALLTIPRAERESRVPALAQALGVGELVYLCTCNRVEVAFIAPAGFSLDTIRHRVFEALAGRAPRGTESPGLMRVWRDEGAAEHLFLVAAGLDSAKVGEQEVSIQVREGVELSRQLGLLGSDLDAILADALKVSRRVRPVTEEHVGQVSLAQVALERVHARLARAPGPVALVGVSPMTEQMARVLSAAGVPLLVVNRTVERARELAASLSADATSLEQFRQAPPALAVVVVATGGGAPVLGRADLERIAARADAGEAPLIVDLSVPPAVRAEDAVAAELPRIGIEEITDAAAQDRGRILIEVAEARALVDEALVELRRRSAERFVGPMIAKLRNRYRHTAAEGVERLFARELSGVGDAEREIIRRWAETLARRFAHLPSVGLRDLAFRAGPSAVEAFFASSEPELLNAPDTASVQADD